MPGQTHPVFLSLHTKLARLEQEITNLRGFVQLVAVTPKEFSSPWGTAMTIGGGVRNAYNGMEDILKAIAKDIDGYVPGGENWHQDLLDQMAAESDVRPVVLGTELYEQMVALKGFRHVMNHNYGTTLKLDKVRENLAILQQTYPQFVEAITSIEAAFSTDCESDADDEQSRPVGPGEQPV
jgi:uncharacterized protein YutE (UPF0331/DUF86 family)